MDQSKKSGGRPVDSSSHYSFGGFIDHFGMIDVGFVGNPFTWSNNRQGLDNIKERLDRGLASPTWVHLRSNFSLIHLPTHNSDHNPISFTTNTISYFLPRPFRFKEFWSKDPSCELVIEAAWQIYFPNYHAACLSKKLTNTKLALLKWNSLHFGNIHKRIKETFTILDSVQQSPATPLAHEQELNLKMDLENLLIKEEFLWCSKSKETKLTCMDLNTKYVHTTTLIRRRSNAINFLKLDSRDWVSSRAKIGGNFIAHFTNLFTSSNPLIENEMLDLFYPIITYEENASLCTTEEEISEALASLGTTKVPGPDGFIALFYKKYWHVFRKDVLVSIE